MATINSNKILVFPTTTRTDDYSKRARLMSEMSLTGLINQLTDTDSFVISQSYSASDVFKFNIHGYYFELSAGALTSVLQTVSASQSLYAHIELTSSSGYVELYGQDSAGSYSGLVLNNAEAYTPVVTGNTVYTLKILSKDARSVISVPKTSLIRFEQDRVDIDEIDGGEI